ncbi:MAG: DUF2721 domain-containing protein [Leptolyngbyaceae cyanobacterium SU_3_3]|nr:DUF2721 domain-containing protein [Leptolyngbyaceae cyanobacterium SU_3_3]NJR51329.1 DUF2721 domain-containing protein [Leptolyngbyaceae cyanobacterium CSU_1_3]
MSVEQTTQLIQLILNSVLMIVACAFVLGGLLLRRSALENRLQTTSLEYYQVLHLTYDSQGDRLLRLKKQLRRLQQQIQSSYNGVLTIYYALMLFVASTFALALRTVVNHTWLISLAMLLFIIGVGILLLSIAIVLLDLYQADRPFWQEMQGMLHFGQTSVTDWREGLQIKRLRSSRAKISRVPRRVT